MRTAPLKLSLLVPGLLSALPGVNARAVVAQHCSAATRLLSRAQQATEGADADTLHYRLLGYSLSATHDLPDAWLSYQFDTGTVPADALLRADPVHLRADQSRLLLFDAAHLDITADEARELSDAFNRHYATDGLRLEFPTPTRGYLHLDAAPTIRTTSLAQVMGRNVDACLPVGPDARHWHGVLNEVQMLFHDHPVNRARETRGKPLVNGLWLWGGGRPLTAAPSDWQRLWSNDPALRGLAWLNGIASGEPPTHADDWLSNVVDGNHMVCLDALRRAAAYADLEHWLAETQRLERDWFAPLEGALKHGRVRELRLYPDDGCSYRVTRWDMLRFWKRFPLHTACSGS